MGNGFRKPFRPGNFPGQQQFGSAPELRNILRMMEEAGLNDNGALQRAVFSAGVANDSHTLNALQQLIQPEWVRTQLDRYQFWPAPKGNEVNGEIHIGDVVGTGAPFGLNPDSEVVSHLLIGGSSGCGKTNANRHIIQQLPEKEVTFFIPDLKDDYGTLGKIIGENNLLVTRLENDLKFNFLQPPQGVKPVQWLQILVDVFAQAFGLMVGSKGFLMQHLDELYKAYGVYEGKENYPSMFEFHKVLEKTRLSPYSRDARFQESSLGRIKTALITLGDVFDCSIGFPLPELIRTNWVLQLHGLSGFIQNFLVLSITCAIFMYRISNNLRSGRLKHVIILDEGKRIADKNLERGPEIPYTDLLISQIREFDTGVILSDQEITKIAESYKANTFTKIGFSLRNGADILDMAKCMSLKREQMEYFNKLKVGQAIVRSGKYPYPFIIQVPYVPIEETLLEDSQANVILENLKAKVMPRLGKEDVKEKESLKLSEQAEEYLRDVLDDPDVPLTTRGDRFGFNAHTTNKIKNELIGEGLVTQYEVNLGRINKFLEITEAGYTYLNVEIPKQKGKGSPKHRYWQRRILNHFEKFLGLKAKIEGNKNGKLADIAVVQRDGKMLAVEVALTPKNEMRNIKEDLAVGFDKVMVACQNKKVEEEVQRRMEEHLDDEAKNSVIVCLLTDFV